MAYINGKEILFSTSLNTVVDDSREMPGIRSAIIARGGNIDENATYEDVPNAILDLPVGDSSYLAVEDNDIAYSKRILSGAAPIVNLKSIGGITRKCKQILYTGYWNLASNTETVNGVTFTNNKNGTFTLNGTATAYTSFEIFNAYMGGGFVDAIKCVGTLYLGFGATLPSTVECLVQTNNEADEGGLGARFSGGSGSVVNVSSWLGAIDIIYLNIQSGTVFNNLVLKPMLSVGSTEQPYEPYYEGLRASKVTAIKECGANLLDISKIANNSGTVTILDNDSFRVDNYNVRFRLLSPKAGTYYLSSKSSRTGSYGGGIVVATYDKSGALIKSNYWYPDKLNSVCQQVCDGTEYELRIIFYGSGSSGGFSATYTNVMLSYNESIPYARYHEPITHEIPEALQSVEGYCEGVDETTFNKLNFGNKLIDKTTYRLVLNGTENWSKQSAATQTNTCLFQLILTHNPFKNTTIVPSICSHFSYNTSIYSSDTPSFTFFYSGATPYIRIRTNHTTVDAFKEWLASLYANGKPVTIIYKLETPTTVDISEELGDFNSLIEVEPFGTVEFVNEYSNDIPSELSYIRRVE